MNICVLMGGTSTERDISIKSGKAVAWGLRSMGHSVIELIVEREDDLWLQENLPKDVDVFFIALHGGKGENGWIQGWLESQGYPYTGSSPQASRVGMNKLLTKRCLIENNLLTPNYVVCTREEDISLPPFGRFVIKPNEGGSSVGVNIAVDVDDVTSSIEEAFKVDDCVLIEEYIEGREITVGMLGDKILEVIEVVPRDSGFFDFSAKYTKGKTEYLLPARFCEEEREYFKKITRLAIESIGARDIARVDMIVRDGQVYILEINTIPGMTETSLVPMMASYEGIEFGQVCVMLCEMALRRSNNCGEKIG